MHIDIVISHFTVIIYEAVITTTWNCIHIKLYHMTLHIMLRTNPGSHRIPHRTAYRRRADDIGNIAPRPCSPWPAGIRRTRTSRIVSPEIHRCRCTSRGTSWSTGRSPRRICDGWGEHWVMLSNLLFNRYETKGTQVGAKVAANVESVNRKEGWIKICCTSVDPKRGKVNAIQFGGMALTKMIKVEGD